MSRTISPVNQFENELAGIDCRLENLKTNPESWQHDLRWTTRQVITCSLWSALLGLACGYAWVLLQIGTYR